MCFKFLGKGQKLSTRAWADGPVGEVAAWQAED